MLTGVVLDTGRGHTVQILASTRQTNNEISEFAAVLVNSALYSGQFLKQKDKRVSNGSDTDDIDGLRAAEIA